MSAPSPLQDLPATPATSIKTAGWRAVSDMARAHGAVLVTSHGEPDAVVLAPEHYALLVNAAAGGDPLTVLRRRFDERMSSLDRPGSAAKLRDAFAAEPTQLGLMADSPLLAG